MTAKVLNYLNATASQTGLKFVFLFEKLLLNLQINYYLINNVFPFLFGCSSQNFIVTEWR